MNHQPQDNRRRAERKFASALDDLETVLKSEQTDSNPSQSDPTDPKPQSRRHPRPQRQATELDETGDFGALLDDAVQDIEQFMASEEPAPDDQ